jgi:hypothetical protein
MSSGLLDFRLSPAIDIEGNPAAAAAPPSMPAFKNSRLLFAIRLLPVHNSVDLGD